MRTTRGARRSWPPADRAWEPPMSGHGALTHRDGRGTWKHAMDIEEPAGGIMNRLRCCRSSDSDGRGLHTAGPGQPAGPRHVTAPNGARRGTRAGRGWTRLKAETCGGPGRAAQAGPQSKMYSWVSVTSHPTVTELSRFSPLYKEQVKS